MKRGTHLWFVPNRQSTQLLLANQKKNYSGGDFLGPRSCTDFFLKLACRCCSKSRIGIVFEQRLTVLVVFGSLVLVNWDRLIFFGPDA